MSELLIGTILKEHKDRDALHVAICSVRANETLHPGNRINFVFPDNAELVKADDDGIGIVDPYLRSFVKKGDIFWMHMLPNTITSLKHQWTHPAFDAIATMIDNRKQEAIDQSKEWIEDFASGLRLTYDELMDGAKDYVFGGDYLVGGSNLEGERVPDEFWEHYQRVTGITVPEDKQSSFFSCSC